MTEKETGRCFLGGDKGKERSVCGSGHIDEQVLLERLEQSALQIKVPESLWPEKISEKCRKLEQDKTTETEQKKFGSGNTKLMGGLCAAAVFIICCISLGGMRMGKMTGNSAGDFAAAPAEMSGMKESAEVTEECAAEDAGEGADTEAMQEERKDAGELYTLAGSYDAVYERLEAVRTNLEMGRGIEAAGAEDGGYLADTGAFSAGIQDLGEEKLQNVAEGAGQYSETNVQTLGIDESDVVKTDGEYLYLLRGSSVSIVSAGGEMRQVSEVKPDTADSEASVCAMYVDGDKLILMMQEYSAGLEQRESREMEDVFYIDTGRSVSILTYDISDREKPVLLGKVTQDGSYMTSRKDGNIVYLFTGQYLLEDYMKNPEEAIPEANGRKVAEDCIYMAGQGERALLISSLSLNHPETLRDTVMILDEGSEIYMGEDSLYLYRTNYREAVETTEIAKFSLTGGFLNGEAATSLRGMVRDTFAVHEKDNRLRVLTTDMSGADWENCLFMLDENLKVTGQLAHIAVGESIYAARYLGDMVYFITYRNTDPLFAVDLSDEKNPKMMGELEITGFSEYLHFWGEDKLFGIGFETDPETGEQKGLKLVMFDMSDPTELKVLGSRVLQETSFTPALYDYKTILVDPGENLIGFVVEYYDGGGKRDYELYRWKENGFEKILSESLTEDGYDNVNYRGIYIGEKFYVAHPEVVRRYDREDYAPEQKLSMK